MRAPAPELPPRLVWTDPLLRLAAELRDDAESVRSAGGDDLRAAWIEGVAGRIDTAIAEGERGEWLGVDDAARLRRIGADGVRAWCRRTLQPRGLARRIGGNWMIHRRAFVGDARGSAK